MRCNLGKQIHSCFDLIIILDLILLAFNRINWKVDLSINMHDSIKMKQLSFCNRQQVERILPLTLMDCLPLLIQLISLLSPSCD